MSVLFREATGADEAFLRELFAATRPAPLNEPVFCALANSQFEARSRAYGECSSDCPLIVEVDGRRAGTLWLWRREEEYRIADLAVAPEFQRKGVARAALARAIDEAGRAGLPLRLTVDRSNVRAICVYEAAGFAVFAATETDLLMELRPAAGSIGAAP